MSGFGFGERRLLAYARKGCSRCRHFYRRSAFGCGRRLLLELFTDASYLFVQRYLCRPWSPAQIKTGSWKTEGEHIVLFSNGDEMRFSMDAGGLDYVGARYGQTGLRLHRLKLPGS